MSGKLFLCLSLLAVLVSCKENPPEENARSVPHFGWMEDVGSRNYPASGKVYHAGDYGAVGDAVMLCTEAIQKAIDDCAANGGGMVSFTPGIFLTGSVFVKSGVDLHIPKGTMLIGSQDIADYRKLDTRVAGIEMKWPAALVNIIDQKNASISGDGVIHGRGKVFWDKYRSMRSEYDPKGLRWVVDYDCERPRGILVSGCSDVTVKDIVLYQAGFWSLHILYSEYVTVDGVIISNNIEGRGPSTDGIDIDSSSKILVQNSNINCNDDNFCLKAGRDADGLRVGRPCEYIVIRDCVAGHGDGLFTCGSETSGNIRHIVAYNMKGIGTKYGLRFKSTSTRGGTIEDIHLHNIEMTGVRDPFVVDLNWYPAYNKSKLPDELDVNTIPEHWKKLMLEVNPHRGMPKFRDIHFENVTATGAGTCIKVSGMENGSIDNFHFRNVHLEGRDAGNIKWAKNWTFDRTTVKSDAGTPVVVENSEHVKL